MIKSRANNDCGVSAIANFRGISWLGGATLLFGLALPRSFSTTTAKISMALGGHRLFKLRRVKRWVDIPDGVIVKVIPPHCEGTRNWHWVVWKNGKIWDSVLS